MIVERAEKLARLVERGRTRNEHLQVLDGFRGQLEEIKKASARLDPLAIGLKPGGRRALCRSP